MPRSSAQGLAVLQLQILVKFDDASKQQSAEKEGMGSRDLQLSLQMSCSKGTLFLC